MKKISVILFLLAAVMMLSCASTGGGRSGKANRTLIKASVDKISKDLINQLPENSTLAVIEVLSDSQDTSLYIVDEIEFKLINARKFNMVEKKRLDAIIAEQNYQKMSGQVDDFSAVSIGKMTGATIVIVGEITKLGPTQRLSIRALDVKTGQILIVSRESF